MSARTSPPLAVVVPGAAVWPGGRASDTLRRRTLSGVALFHDVNARYLVLTGGQGRHPPAEAVVAAAIARQHGVAEHAILCEDQSKNSFENVVLAREKLGGAAIANQDIVVISDWYHLPRLWLTLRAIGQAGQVRAVPRRAYRSLASSLQWRPFLNEWIKLPFYTLTLHRRWRHWQNTRGKNQNEP